MLLGRGGREGCTNLDPPELCYQRYIQCCKGEEDERDVLTWTLLSCVIRDIMNVFRERRTRGMY